MAQLISEKMSTTSFLAQFGSSNVLERMNFEISKMFLKSLILKAAFFNQKSSLHRHMILKNI